jgi:alpha-1,2-mannosyltransferase
VLHPRLWVTLDWLDRHGRRLVWGLWFLLLFIAACVYAGKAADERSAFIRWRHQVGDFWDGVNIWDVYMFPNPPIMPLTLSPLMLLPPVLGAVAWFAIKAAMASACVVLVGRMAAGRGRPITWWVEGAAMLFSLRPILSDLHHGNINLLILFLIVASLEAWRRGYDVLAGLILALAITYKVTPALFVPYFAWKRSWRTVGATALGMGLFLLAVPAVVLGPAFNGQCLAMWWHRILSPYLTRDVMSVQEVNQSMIGVLSRLLTQGTEGRYERLLDLNLASWPPSTVATLAKILSIGLVGLLLALCRTRATRRDDPRLLGEFALVVLTMLIVSERSWKHHFVTLLLPYVYLCYLAYVAPAPFRLRVALTGFLWASVLLILTTSSEVGGQFASGLGHKIALYYGMFFWGAVALYVATAWQVLGRRDRPIDEPSVAAGPVPGPHRRPASVRQDA